MNTSSTNADCSIKEELELVCKELDDLALQYLGKLEEYTHQRQITSSRLQQGFLHLAHAKYTMGSGKISQYSYDERMKAQVRVSIDNHGETPKIRLISSNEEVLKDKSGNSHEGREATGIRQRHTKKQENSEWIQDENLRDSAEREEYEMNEKRPTLNGRKKATGKRDPLHWFGLLVSPSLRFSQDHFKTATVLLIDQMNSIIELDKLEAKYRSLEAKKSQLTSRLTSINKDDGI
ncbi:hypothetical protein VTP01DRAFT_8686 [Rhizomucor pusillus]|uniref:uncharacterized protein n=1 Tax=Rhizomucor pusillus TaxID=4840 RepID=UPI00374472BC